VCYSFHPIVASMLQSFQQSTERQPQGHIEIC
jgi:hypothetical protein